MLADLVTRRECWALTWRGRLALGTLLMAASAFAVLEIHPFLAVTDRMPARLLVIEGWVLATTSRQVAAEFRSGGYDRAVLIRPVLGQDDQYESGGYPWNRMVTLLAQHGVPNEQLTTLTVDVAEKDRTYHAALAVKRWLTEQGLSMQSINVATRGPHARRSRLVYHKAFGERWQVGVIALGNLEYDPAHWWRTSAGVREVIGESISYFYARLFFFPTSK